MRARRCGSTRGSLRSPPVKKPNEFHGMQSFVQPGHGAGKGVPHVEVPRDLAPPVGYPVKPEVVQRTPRGQFVPGNTVGRGKRVRLKKSGGAISLYATPQYKLFLKWGKDYADHRRVELSNAHGGKISAGVGMMIENAALNTANAHYLQWIATGGNGETANLPVSDLSAILKTASQLRTEARQQELAAWQLAAQEAKVQPQTNPHTNLLTAIENEST